MRKTLLSAIAGLAVIGSAAALPTPDAARQNCEKQEAEGTHVWVEKNAECIPIDPCESNNSKTKNSYCLVPVHFTNHDAINKFLKRYVTDIMQDEIKKQNEIELYKDNYSVSAKTKKGNYISFHATIVKNEVNQTNSAMLVKPICMVFNLASNGAECERTSEDICQGMNVFAKELFDSSGVEMKYIKYARDDNKTPYGVYDVCHLYGPGEAAKSESQHDTNEYKHNSVYYNF